MNKHVFASLSAAAVISIYSISAAKANNVDISNVGFIGDTVTVAGSVANTLGWTNPFSVSVNAGIIPLTTSYGAVLPVFCIDLFHDIDIGSYNPPLSYTFGTITNNSSSDPSGTGGSSLGAPAPGEIQTLVNIGASDYEHGTGNADIYAGLQGAIWQIEYNTNGNSLTVTGSTQVDNLIASFEAYAVANPENYSISLFPGADGTAYGSGQAFASATAPEPSPWAMMIIGFAGLGFAGYRARRSPIAIA